MHLPGQAGYSGVILLFFLSLRLPAIASRSGEAGGDETEKNNPLARRGNTLFMPKWGRGRSEERRGHGEKFLPVMGSR